MRTEGSNVVPSHVEKLHGQWHTDRASDTMPGL